MIFLRLPSRTKRGHVPGVPPRSAPGYVMLLPTVNCVGFLYIGLIHQTL